MSFTMFDILIKILSDYEALDPNTGDIMLLVIQLYFHLSFILIEIKFYSFSFLCDVCNEVNEHIQCSSEL